MVFIEDGAIDYLNEDLPEGLYLTQYHHNKLLRHKTKGLIDKGTDVFIFDKKYPRIKHEDNTYSLYDEDGTPLKYAQNVKNCGISSDFKHYWTSDGKKTHQYLLPEAKIARAVKIAVGLLTLSACFAFAKCSDLRQKEEMPKNNNQTTAVSKTNYFPANKPFHAFLSKEFTRE